MNENNSVYKDAAKVSIVILIFTVIEIALFLIAGKFGKDVVFGALYGGIFASLNFFFLAYSVKQSVKKGEKAAKAYMSGTYTIRILLTGVMIYFAAKLDIFNVWAAILPLIFPRIAIFIITLINKKGGAET